MKILVLALLASCVGCASFISDDTVYERDAIRVEVNYFPALTTVDGATAALPSMGPVFGENGMTFVNTNGGGSRSENEVSSMLRAALTGKGKATNEGGADTISSGDGE